MTYGYTEKGELMQHEPPTHCTFTLTIKLGNDAMQTPSDLGEALEDLADRLREAETLDAAGHGIRDYNGNTVGSWTVQ